MKKLYVALTSLLLLCSCGVGSYSVVSGKADEGMISFVSEKAMPVTVNVDGNAFSVNTVKAKAWQKNRNIKKTVQNTVVVSPGQHEITVSGEGTQIFRKTVFISAQEHKVVEL